MTHYKQNDGLVTPPLNENCMKSYNNFNKNVSAFNDNDMISNVESNLVVIPLKDSNTIEKTNTIVTHREKKGSVVKPSQILPHQPNKGINATNLNDTTGTDEENILHEEGIIVTIRHNYKKSNDIKLPIISQKNLL